MTSAGSHPSVIKISESKNSGHLMSPKWDVPRIESSEVGQGEPENISLSSLLSDSQSNYQIDEEVFKQLNTQDEHPVFFKSTKRSLSSSNDMLYERDRFRARLSTLNQNLEVTEDYQIPINRSKSPAEGWKCELCNTMSHKTTKLTISKDAGEELNFEGDKSPLDSESKFFRDKLGVIESFRDVHEKVEIRSIRMDELERVFRWYFNQPLPATQDMFPWLHGLHRENFSQKSFFLRENRMVISSSEAHSVPQNARFLMCVDSTPNSQYSVPLLKNSVKLHEILSPIDVAKSYATEIIFRIVSKVFAGESLDAIEKLRDQYLLDCLSLSKLPLFLDLDPPSGVSLRNFHIQVSKTVLYSDIIVYCFEKGHISGKCNCDAVARVLWLAQKNQALDSVSSPSFNVLKADDLYFYEKLFTKSVIFADHMDLFTLVPSKTTDFASIIFQNNFKLDGFLLGTLLAWDIDYPSKEKLETTKMSEATMLKKNFWVGNSWDFQIMSAYINGYPVQIKECYDVNLYCNSNNSITLWNLDSEEFSDNSSSFMKYLPCPKADWKLFVKCHNDTSFPELNVLGDLMKAYSQKDKTGVEIRSTYTSIDFPSSGSIGIGDCRKDTFLKFVNICKLIYMVCTETKDSPGLKCLIYCSDGYTESSLLVLSYIMYSEAVDLSEAILKLHLVYGRPYYLFNSDVGVLSKLQSILHKFSPAKRNDIDWTELEELSDSDLNKMLLANSNSLRSSDMSGYFRLGFIESEEDNDFDSEPFFSSTPLGAYSVENEQFVSEDQVSLDGQDARQLVKEVSECLSDDSDDSLYDPNWVQKVEGSLPSRILDYLYLGSLKHANNLTLLKKLGISKIISVGEDLEFINDPEFKSKFNVSREEEANQGIEFIRLSPLKHNGKPCPIDTIMKVNNLQDDGIDQLSNSLPKILDFLQKIYDESEGKAKILIHCRVGVSRSATVVIAEVMRRLKVSLARAYLYVRVRRLNIIIQPNLMFMYELFKWEESQKVISWEKSKELSSNSDPRTSSLRDIDWFVMCREIMNLNIPYLAK